MGLAKVMDVSMAVANEIISHVCMSHVTHTNEWCNTYKRVVTHEWTYKSHVRFNGQPTNDIESRCVAACCSMLQHVAARCSKLQHDAACASVLQHVALCCNVLFTTAMCVVTTTHNDAATHCNIATHQHYNTATHRTTLETVSTPCKPVQTSNTPHHTANYFTTLQTTSTHCSTHYNTLQHTKTHCNTYNRNVCLNGQTGGSRFQHFNAPVCTSWPLCVNKHEYHRAKHFLYIHRTFSIYIPNIFLCVPVNISWPLCKQCVCVCACVCECVHMFYVCDTATDCNALKHSATRCVKKCEFFRVRARVCVRACVCVLCEQQNGIAVVG